MTPKAQLRAIWQAGVDAVTGDRAVASALANDIPRPDHILAVGKAAGAMAQAASGPFPDVPCLVVTKDGHGAGLPNRIQVIEAAHPVPDARSLEGGAALARAVEAMAPGSHLLLLVSGGASSLVENLHDGLKLSDLAQLNARLLAAGLDIGAMNAERRRISRIKGGGLLGLFHGVRATVLAISDVPRDEIGVIGSGIGAAPATHDFHYDCRIIASNAIARTHAAQAAVAAGLTVTGNEETLYDDVPALATALRARLRDLPKGLLILGGEPTVHLPDNPGQGGRNQALALELAREIAGRDDMTILVAGTDGTDGPTEAAGAIVDGRTWGPGAADALKAADSGRYLEARDALLTTGPTGTNVMDLALVLRA